MMHFDMLCYCSAIAVIFCHYTASANNMGRKLQL